MKIIFIKTEKGKQGESCYDQVHKYLEFILYYTTIPSISTDAIQDLQNTIAER